MNMVTVPLDYVRVYNNVLPSVVCDHLIHTIRNSWDKKVVDHNGRPTFTELNINETHPELVNNLVSFARYVINQYYGDVQYCKDFTPPLRGMEEFRVKCYNGGSDDRFDTHVDVGDITSCKRYLSLLFYLNDDFEGGETSFLDYNPDYGEYQDMFDIIPKTGSVMVFPPMWMFPHRGRPVISGTKYIMSTYLNYT